MSIGIKYDYEKMREVELHSEEKIEYESLMNRLKPFHDWGGMYKIPQENLLIKEVTELAERYDKLSFSVYFEAKFTKKEMEQAVAYMPYFHRMCFEYDDTGDFTETICKECDCQKQIYDLEIMNQGSIKKSKVDYATYKHEGEDYSIISIPMYEYLSSNGIEQCYFRPIYARRDKKNPLAYQIYSENVLPEAAVISKENRYEMCSSCHNIEAKPQNTLQYEPYYMIEEMIEQMKPVNITKEYYGRDQLLVVSKEVYHMIKEKDLRANFIPIFKKI
ncbi:MAG: hypothetical protein Q4F05_14950 [bacterium]|nr:hypothetical protein [bacterium]